MVNVCRTVVRLAFIQAILLSSCAENPVGSKNVTAYDVYITGKIVNQNGEPTVGAVVSVSVKGLSDTTGDDGLYLLAQEQNTTTASKRLSPLTQPDSLRVEKDNQVVYNAELQSLIDTLPNLTLVQRDIWGEIDTVAGITIESVEASLKEEGHNDTKHVQLWFNAASASYSGFVYSVSMVEVKEYSVSVIVYNEENEIVGRSPTLDFPSTAGDIKMPTFPAYNPPVLPEIMDTTVSFTTDNSVMVRADTAAIRSITPVVKYYWGYIGLEFFDSTNIPEFTISSDSGGPVSIYWAAVDQDGLKSTSDTFTVNFNRPPGNLGVTLPTSFDDIFSYSAEEADLLFSANDPDGTEENLTYTVHTGLSRSALEEVYSGIDNSCRLTFEDMFSSVYYRLVVTDTYGDSAVLEDSILPPSYTPSWEIFTDTIEGGNTYADLQVSNVAEFQFQFGDYMEVFWGQMDPYSGLIAYVDSSRDYIDLSDADSVSFWAKADRQITAQFQIGTQGVDNLDEEKAFIQFCHYQKTLGLDTSWQKYSVILTKGENVGGFTQPSWAPNVQWNTDRVNSFKWVVRKMDNNDSLQNVTSGTIMIKGLKLETR